MTKSALILGVGGQDGSYLAEVLLAQGYAVHGLYRRSSVDNLWRIAHVRDRITLHQGDIADNSSVVRILDAVQPDEIYNEADQDHVGWSYAVPGYSLDITARAVATLLEAVRRQVPKARVFQPVSATMFGDAPPPQNEQTPFNPQSPYACAKVAAYYLARYYRQAYGMFVSTAILYNHDSPRRRGNYLLHDICDGALAVADGKQDKLLVGCLDMLVDIGFAGEYMAAAHKLLQLPEPDDVVIGCGVAPSIRHMAECALRAVGVDPHDRLGINPAFNRPGKQPQLRGDIRKAQQLLGFAPKIGVAELIPMVLETKSCA